MNRYLVVIAAAALAGALASSPARARALTAGTVRGSGWGAAQEIPGTAKLNQGGDAGLTSVSCGSAGNCSAAGFYTDSSGHSQAFVASQVNGTWGTAEKVPGTARLNQGGSTELNSMSCSSVGNCSAGGFYTDSRSGQSQAFVVSQVNGTWGTAEAVPGIARLSHDGYSDPLSVSCGAAGNCSAGGVYTDGDTGPRQAFVVSQVHGTWGTAKQVPGTAKLNQGGDAELFSVSCRAAGNCSGGGDYTDGDGNGQAFLISQVHGTWGTAKQVPGTAKLNQGGSAGIGSVSCSSAGNCSAAGGYTDGDGHGQAFVLSQVHGTWGTATQVPGTATLNQGGDAELTSVSCGPAGNCSAGGFYANRPGHIQAFVVSQVNGTWGTAKEVPGTATLNQGGGAGITSVSCGPAGNCGAGGFYTGKPGHMQVFVVSRTSRPGMGHRVPKLPSARMG